MPVIDGRRAEIEYVLEVAKLMCIAARTAPKGRGVDNIVTAIVYGEYIERVADEMERLADELGYKFFLRDADSVRKAHALVLIGLRDAKPLGLNCELCGYPCEQLARITRERRVFRAPVCAMKLLDLGIAIGSAVKIASLLNVDNRIMFSVGVAARRLGLIDADIVIGIPLAVYGKNPFFDRPPLERYISSQKF